MGGKGACAKNVVIGKSKSRSIYWKPDWIRERPLRENGGECRFHTLHVTTIIIIYILYIINAEFLIYSGSLVSLSIALSVLHSMSLDNIIDIDEQALVIPVHCPFIVINYMLIKIPPIMILSNYKCDIACRLSWVIFTNTHVHTFYVVTKLILCLYAHIMY